LGTGSIYNIFVKKNSFYGKYASKKSRVKKNGAAGGQTGGSGSTPKRQF
jgi:hypothetical protein